MFCKCSADNYWLRSPLASSSTNFANVNNNGNGNSNNATNSNGVAFGSSPAFGSSLADKVVHAAKSDPRWREGEHDRPEMVNMYSDGSGRTLFAWQRLAMMCCFMPGDPMQLHVIARKLCGYRGNTMTSEERHQARYLRRRARRDAAKAERLADADNYDKVFTYEHLYDAYRKCRRNVGWKASVQRYAAQAPLNIQRTREKLLAGKYKCPEFFEFDIFERGKKRHIKSTVIGERVVQRCLCDYALVPVIGRSFIYDNGACIKNKGYDFAARRMKSHLERYIRENGTEGYVLIGDLKSFFDSIPHSSVERIVESKFQDPRIKALIMAMVRQFDPAAPDGEGVGLGLGSQVSQVLAPAVPGSMDHFVKETMGVKYYGRYMDDFYLIHRDKAFLHECMEAIREKCAEAGLVLSDRKTQIVKLTHGFTFLKVRIFVTKDGKIVRKIHRSSVTRERRKLKKLKRLLENGEMTAEDVYNCFQSWASHCQRFQSWRTMENMKTLYAELFIPEGGQTHEHLHQDPG